MFRNGGPRRFTFRPCAVGSRIDEGAPAAQAASEIHLPTRPQKTERSMTAVKAGDTVRIHYTCTLSDWTVFDYS